MSSLFIAALNSAIATAASIVVFASPFTFFAFSCRSVSASSNRFLWASACNLSISLLNFNAWVWCSCSSIAIVSAVSISSSFNFCLSSSVWASCRAASSCSSSLLFESVIASAWSL